jgi:hypothetical protein
MPFEWSRSPPNNGKSTEWDSACIGNAVEGNTLQIETAAFRQYMR